MFIFVSAIRCNHTQINVILIAIKIINYMYNLNYHIISHTIRTRVQCEAKKYL